MSQRKRKRQQNENAVTDNDLEQDLEDQAARLRQTLALLSHSYREAALGSSKRTVTLPGDEARKLIAQARGNR